MVKKTKKIDILPTHNQCRSWFGLFLLLIGGWLAATITESAAVEGLGKSKETARFYIETARKNEAEAKYDAAARLMLMTAEVWPAVADGALDEAARLQMLAGDYQGAITSLLRLQNDFGNRAAATDVLERLARAHESAGLDDQARQLHLQAAAVVASDNRQAFHLVRAAELSIALNDKKSALEYLNRVLNQMNPNRYTIRAMELYEEWAIPNDPISQAAHAEGLGLRFYQANAFEQAGPALDRAIRLRRQAKVDTSPESDIWKKAGHSFYRTHHNEQALAYYEPLVAAQGGASVDTYLELSRLHTRLGQPVGAKHAYESIVQDPSGRQRQTANYYLAWLNIEEEEYQQAYAYFNRRNQQTRKTNGEIMWLTAWTAYRSGQPKTALALLESLSKLRRGGEPLRTQYWKGRLQLETGQKKTGLQTLKDLNRKNPVDYYGMLAGELLAEQGATAVSALSKMSEFKSGGYAVGRPPRNWWREYEELQPALGHIIELTEMDLWRAAAAEISRLKIPTRMSPQDELELARLCHSAKRYDIARTLAYRGGVYHYLSNSRESLLQTYYPYFMPLGYYDTVMKYAKRFDLPPALIFAIILHESGYRPQVVSPAYAVGLMQLLPQTGAEVAAALGETYEEDSLDDPETNIRYGCWYLRHLLDALGGDPAFAIAAYNAGPKAVGKWLRNKPQSPQAFFVEEITYTETNRYVRRVLTSMKKYEAQLQAMNSLR